MTKLFQILCAIVLVLTNGFAVGCCTIASIEQFDGMRMHLLKTPYFHLKVSGFYLLMSILVLIICSIICIIELWILLQYFYKDDDVNHQAVLEKYMTTGAVQFVDGEEIPTQ